MKLRVDIPAEIKISIKHKQEGGGGKKKGGLYYEEFMA